MPVPSGILFYLLLLLSGESGQTVSSDDLDQGPPVSICLGVSAAADPGCILIVASAPDQPREICADIGIISFHRCPFRPIPASVDAEEIVVRYYPAIAGLKDRLGDYDRCQDVVFSLIVPCHLSDPVYESASFFCKSALYKSAIPIKLAGDSVHLSGASRISCPESAFLFLRREVILFAVDCMPS